VSEAAAVDPAESESLPPLYQGWLEEILPGPIPRERIATCTDCAMCAKNGDAAAPPGQDFFNPETKCCTYFPALPNYLVGRAIHAPSPAADVLRGFIEGNDSDRVHISLRGVMPRDDYWQRYRANGAKGFGHDANLRCPYIINQDGPEGPLCGIWQHRNSVCSTWFCKHVRGNVGRSFWQSVLNMFMQLENTLAWWCIAELIDNHDQLIRQKVPSEAGGADLQLLENEWDFWPGSRIEFFEACAEKVHALSWEEVVAVAGIEHRLRATELRTNHGRLTDMTPPDRLRAGSYEVFSNDGQRTRLRSTGSLEFFEAPNALISLLHYFDGRPTEDVLAHIQQEQRINLAPGLVRKLYDFGVLTPVDD